MAYDASQSGWEGLTGQDAGQEAHGGAGTPAVERAIG